MTTFQTKLVLKNYSKLNLHLHQTLLSRFLISRHERLANFSDFIQYKLTNTQVQRTNSVLISSPVTAHSKKFSCWIDSEFFKSSSIVHIKKLQKCNYVSQPFWNILRPKQVLQESSRMVWISDLDNPKVFSRPFTNDNRKKRKVFLLYEKFFDQYGKTCRVNPLIFRTNEKKMLLLIILRKFLCFFTPLNKDKIII